MATDAYGHDDMCCGEQQQAARVEVEVLSAVGAVINRRAKVRDSLTFPLPALLIKVNARRWGAGRPAGTKAGARGQAASMVASFLASLCPLLPFSVLSRSPWDAILGCFVSLTSGVHEGPSQGVECLCHGHHHPS